MNTLIIVSIILLLVAFFSKPVYKLLSHKSLYPLLPKQYNFKRRRNSFRLTMKLLEQLNAKVLVETGVARKGLQNTKYDGASTIVFGLWAKQNEAVLYSVDIDPVAVEEAKMGLMTLYSSTSLIPLLFWSGSTVRLTFCISTATITPSEILKGRKPAESII